MKPILLILVLSFSFSSLLFSQKISRKTIEGHYKCSPKTEFSTDENPSPKWTDKRLNVDNEDIIKEGTLIALKRLNCISNESNFINFYNWTSVGGPSRRTEPLTNEVLDFAIESRCEGIFCLTDYRRIPIGGDLYGNNPYTGSYLQPNNSRVELSVIYRKLPGGEDIQARMSPKIKQAVSDCRQKKTDNRPKGSPLRGYGNWHSAGFQKDGFEDYKCIREKLIIEIEIFDVIFDSEELWIPSEERWAKTPLEAVVYLVLHEISHAENFLYKSSEFNYYTHYNYKKKQKLRPFDDTENAAWEFASTVVRICNEK